jgi:hypothetical protein
MSASAVSAVALRPIETWGWLTLRTGLQDARETPASPRLAPELADALRQMPDADMDRP